ncbi:MAG: hypothetical protein JW867_07355 [Candidatus Omnitrophica bacterium]|nr:hypothetical protein [Candidatus Omnitrophota bacterium]
MSEAKKEKKAKSDGSKSIIKVIIGLIFIAAGIWLIIKYWSALMTVFLGCIGLFLVMAGAITIAIAKE